MDKYDYDFISLNKYYIKKRFPGRYDYLTGKFDLIQEYVDKRGFEVKMHSKEKYGRFDITPWLGADEWIMEHIYEIEDRTPFICIDCGKELKTAYGGQNRRDLGWVLPRCTKCFKVKLKEREEIIRERELKQNESNIIIENESKNND